MRRGFTLVEVLVALVLGGFLALLAQRTWAVAGDVSRIITTQEAEAGDRASLRRWLEEIVGSMDTGTPGASEFRGTDATLSGTAWVTTPEGWQERMSVELRLAGPLVICQSGRGQLELGPALWWRLDYLSGAGTEVRWYPEWQSQVTLPRAVRIQLGHQGTQEVDTVLVVLGQRG